MVSAPCHSSRGPRGHRLLDLWEPIEQYLTSKGLKFEDGQFHYRVRCLVREYDTVDEFGDRFRYPDSRSPTASNWIRGQFSVLRLAAAEIDLLCFGFEQLVGALEAKDA